MPLKAVVFREFGGPFEITEVARPQPLDHGVVVEVKANGVCRSDWHAWQGHDGSISLPHVPGHELAGVVAAVGSDVTGWQLGDRVTVPFACGCGTCPGCLAGNTNLCEREYQPGFDGWGAFAEYVAVPWADVNLARLPDDLGFVEAASLGCRLITAFHGLTDRVDLQSGEWLAVHGAGGVGLSAVQVGAAVGANVVAVDLDDTKLGLARSLGATATVNAANDDPVKAVRDLTEGGAHVSIDALGSTITAQNSLRCLRRRGRHLQIGLVIGEGRNLPIPMSRVISLELAIFGSHGMPARRYPEVFELLNRGMIRPEQMIGRTIPLEEAPDALVGMETFAHTGVTVIEL